MKLLNNLMSDVKLVLKNLIPRLIVSATSVLHTTLRITISSLPYEVRERAISAACLVMGINFILYNNYLM